MKNYIAPVLFVVVLLSSAAFGQAYRFEGNNLILQTPKDHRAATCAIRYAPPTTEIKITDLNGATPFSLKTCGDSQNFLRVTDSKTGYVRAGGRDFKWCFEGEDESYQVEFRGDQYAPNIKYIWRANPPKEDGGRYNVMDFGATGDGTTDDTLSIQSALAFIATKNGGTLYFPDGDYRVGSLPGFDGLTLPSGIVLEGVSGLHSNAATNNIKRRNASRIRLAAPNQSVFKIGECTEHVTLKDLELDGGGLPGTVGFDAFGAWLSSQGFNFERVSFSNFYRGIQVNGLQQTNLNWQFDYIKIKDSRFILNTDTGIYCNTRNSDWKIEGVQFVNPKAGRNQNAYSMHFDHVGMVLVEDTFAGGFPGALGGAFLNVLDSGNLTVIGSQAEAVTHSLVYNVAENPYAGDYTYPITFVNSVFDAPIVFKARRTFVSSGSFYGPKTFQADERVRVYSTGDRFCYDGHILGCRGPVSDNFDRATIVFMTGQPSEGSVQGRPTVFGTDVDFNGVVRMPVFRLEKLPTGQPNGAMIYCENCSRNSNPCKSGSGAPAMMVSGRWSCL
ncbi:MAG: glycosyl hydrolase family 28-related protein [Pyrinomonadaceae bacterium]